MAPIGYIEVLDAKGSVIDRVPIGSFPVRIGRAYRNHVILTDPYVSPMHAEIAVEEDGRLMARDLESVNGLSADGRRGSVRVLELRSGSQFRIGRTQLRYCSVDHPPGPTLVDRDSGRFWTTSPYVAAASCIAVFLLLCLDAYLATVERATPAAIVSEPLATFAMVLLWAGLWALASRVVVSRFHFSPHVSIACGAIVAFFLLSAMAEWLEFLWPFVPALWIAGLSGSAIMMAMLVYGHLKFASGLLRRSRFWAGLSAGVVLAGVSVISDYAARSKFSNLMEFTGIVKPIDAAWVPTSTVDEFIERSQKLKTDLDALAREARSVQP